MASKGQEKWQKYFKGKEVKTFIKAPPGVTIPVVDGNHKHKPYYLIDGYEITVLKSTSYSPQYAIKYKYCGKTAIGTISEAAVAKPIGKTHSASLNAATVHTFTTGGKKMKLFYMGKHIDVLEFYSPKQLQDSILEGLTHVQKDVDGTHLSFIEFFRNGGKVLPWTSETSGEARDRFGSLIGELLVGWYYLKGQVSATNFKPPPDTRKAVAFYIPTDPSFRGIDSLIQFDDGSYLPISNKFGRGAKASLFSNIMAQAMLMNLALSSEFAMLCEFAQQAGVDHSDLDHKLKSMNVVYEYGIGRILGKNYLQDKMRIYHSLTTDAEITDEAKMIVRAIRDSGLADPDVLAHLPKSVTAFFCRTIANRLNSNPASLDQMINIMSGRKFWQAHLNKTQWRKGDVKFKMVNTQSMNIRIFGNKSAVNDLAARHGTVNYELTSK